MQAHIHRSRYRGFKPNKLCRELSAHLWLVIFGLCTLRKAKSQIKASNSACCLHLNHTMYAVRVRFKQHHLILGGKHEEQAMN